MFFRMFLPQYGWGYLGKSAGLQWAAIQEEVVAKLDLTESSVNAKEEELQQRLRTVDQEIYDSQHTDQSDAEPTDDALNTSYISFGMHIHILPIKI
jgi:hypothetical protein